MSAESDGPSKTPGVVHMGKDQKGRDVLAMPYDESMAEETLNKKLSQKAEEPAPSSGSNEGSTPTPDGDGKGADIDGGPIRRFNDVFTNLGSVQLEALGLEGHEIASSTSKLRDEMYRSQFPIIQPRFAAKCIDEDCGAEYESDADFCVRCARLEMMGDGISNPPVDEEEIPEEYQKHDVRPPNPSEKRVARQMSESVNKEGQSLRELMKLAEDDQSRLGVSVLVVKKNYVVARGDASVFRKGEILYEEADEVIRGDPKRIVPVVDENSRVGGHEWTCPVHRDEAAVFQDEYDDGHTNCEECGAALREVYFVETEGPSRRGGGGRVGNNAVKKRFFSDEVITWARYYPRLHGLDGLSPIHHIWLKQVILHWMDVYGAAFYDPDSESYPNKFMVVHTTNPDSWEKQFEKAEEEARDNPYSEQIMYNEYSVESSSTPEVQVIDLMNDDLIGQDEQIRDQYKQDIRTTFGVTNIFDSELKDAGGLNNEGLQIEVTDREIASAMRDTVAGPLDELSKALGINDYIYEFVPPQDTNVDELRDNISVGEDAVGAGLEARLEDGKVVVDDGEFEQAEGEEGGGGLGALFSGEFDSLEDIVSHKADGQSVDVYRLVAPDDSDYDADLLGVAVDMPEHDIYVDWYLEAWGDERLDNPHVSVYGSMDDLRRVADGEPELIGTVDTEAEFKAVVNEKANGDGSADAAGPWRADGTERTPATRGAKEETKRKRHEDVVFTNPGGDPFESQDALEAFLDDLNEAADAVYIDEQEWPADDYGLHDRPVYASGLSVEDAEAILADHEEERSSLFDPSETDLSEHEWLEGEEGNESAGGVDEEKLEAVRKLDDAYRHIVWADETTKASPFWDDEGSIPEFVLEVIQDVAPGVVWQNIDSMPGVLQTTLSATFAEQLTQPQGWSLRSIADNLAEEFNIDPERAELVARTESASILNEAREEGYRRAGALDDERLFQWTGPLDDRTTECCRWLSQVTGWDDGRDMINEYGRPQSVDTVGEPVTYNELISLQREAQQMFFPRLGYRKHVMHPNERFTFTESFKMDVPAAAGPVSVDIDVDASPAMSGTFVMAN